MQDGAWARRFFLITSGAHCRAILTINPVCSHFFCARSNKYCGCWLYRRPNRGPKTPQIDDDIHSRSKVRFTFLALPRLQLAEPELRTLRSTPGGRICDDITTKNATSVKREPKRTKTPLAVLSPPPCADSSSSFLFFEKICSENLTPKLSRARGLQIDVAHIFPAIV